MEIIQKFWVKLVKLTKTTLKPNIEKVCYI